MSGWHVQVGSEAKGPFSDEQLKALCEAGSVTAGTMVWRSDYAEWKPLAETDFRFKEALSPPPLAAQSPPPAEAVGVSGISSRANSQPPSADDYLGEDLSIWAYFTRAVSQKYADFSGRARRKEYWGFTLFAYIVIFLLVFAGVFIDVLLGNIKENGNNQAIVTVIFAGIGLLVFFIPSLAVTVRRVHDIGISGWIILVMFIPYIGSLILFIMALIPSDKGRNKYGPSPLGPNQ